MKGKLCMCHSCWDGRTDPATHAPPVVPRENKLMHVTVRDFVEERGTLYGHPETNLGCAAALWEAYLNGRTMGVRAHYNAITPHDVACMMVLLKIARAATGAYHEDNYIDMKGYAEIAQRLGGK